MAVATGAPQARSRGAQPSGLRARSWLLALVRAAARALPRRRALLFALLLALTPTLTRAASLLAPAGSTADSPGCAAVGEALLTHALVAGRPTAAGPPAWQAVDLPHAVSRADMRAGLPVRYRFELGACALPRHLMIHRVGAAFRIHSGESPGGPALRRLSGQPDRDVKAGAVAPGAPSALADTALLNGRVPTLFEVPAGVRSVEVELVGPQYVLQGITPVWIGAVGEVLPRYGAAEFEVIGSTRLHAVLTIFLGTLVFIIWRRRRADPGLKWFQLVCAVWSLRGFLISMVELPVSPDLFEFGVVSFVFLILMTLTFVTLHLYHRATPQRVRWVSALSAAMVAIMVYGLWVPTHAFAARTLVFTLSALGLMSLVFFAWQWRAAVQHGRGGLMMIGYGAVLASGLHDFLMIQGWLGWGHFSALIWGFSVLLVAYAIVTADRVVVSLNQAEQVNEVLEARVAAKTEELRAVYAAQNLREVQLARTLERERIVREMHDGIGGQLMTALRGVERGVFSQERVAQVLQESLDDLRLLIDASANGSQLQPALAGWRNRWDARLEALGIELVWRIDETLDAVDLPADVVLQLMRILQEAVYNVVKHANARSVQVRASRQQGHLHLDVEDDGVGIEAIDPSDPAPGHYGLRSMRSRAAVIGAELRLARRASGGTCVSVRLPEALRSSRPGGAVSA